MTYKIQGSIYINVEDETSRSRPSVRARRWGKLASNETVCYRNKEVLRVKRLYTICITLCIVSMLIYIEEVDTMGLLL